MSEGLRAEETSLYADAHPYLDDLLPDLERKIPDLKGLQPASDQEPLSDLLRKVGSNVDELVQKVPNLTSDEQVTETQSAGIQPSCGPRSSCPPNLGGKNQKAYHYILLSHQTPEGRILEEDRTDEQDNPVESGKGGPNFQGFVGSWVVFSPSNRSESHFEYLGEQKLGKRKSFVVAFAQIPGEVQVPGTMTSQRRIIPILFQGIAWIDQEDFRILQLRTDILQPQLEVGLQKQTAKISFGPVEISQLGLKLWLPMSVDVHLEANGLFYQEQHVYSKYRMYHATSRILPASP